MKRKISVLAAVLLAIGLTACGNDETQATHDAAQTVWAESSEEVKTTDNTEEEAQQVETSDIASNTNDEIVEDTSTENTGGSEENSGVLVVYFSATRTTKGVAEKIASKEAYGKYKGCGICYPLKDKVLLFTYFQDKNIIDKPVILEGAEYDPTDGKSIWLAQRLVEFLHYFNIPFESPGK